MEELIRELPRLQQSGPYDAQVTLIPLYCPLRQGVGGGGG